MPSTNSRVAVYFPAELYETLLDFMKTEQIASASRATVEIVQRYSQIETGEKTKSNQQVLAELASVRTQLAHLTETVQTLARHADQFSTERLNPAPDSTQPSTPSSPPLDSTVQAFRDRLFAAWNQIANDLLGEEADPYSESMPWYGHPIPLKQIAIALEMPLSEFLEQLSNTYQQIPYLDLIDHQRQPNHTVGDRPAYWLTFMPDFIEEIPSSQLVPTVKGWSEQDLADRLGISPSTLAKERRTRFMPNFASYTCGKDPYRQSWIYFKGWYYPSRSLHRLQPGEAPPNLEELSEMQEQEPIDPAIAAELAWQEAMIRDFVESQPINCPVCGSGKVQKPRKSRGIGQRQRQRSYKCRECGNLF